jgi:hypothetical protein
LTFAYCDPNASVGPPLPRQRRLDPPSGPDPHTVRRRELHDAGLTQTQIGADRGFLLGGRPSAFPCALARSSPDFTRSRVIARWNPAKTPSFATAPYWPVLVPHVAAMWRVGTLTGLWITLQSEPLDLNRHPPSSPRRRHAARIETVGDLPQRCCTLGAQFSDDRREVRRPLLGFSPARGQPDEPPLLGDLGQVPTVTTELHSTRLGGLSARRPD